VKNVLFCLNKGELSSKSKSN